MLSQFAQGHRSQLPLNTPVDGAAAIRVEPQKGIDRELEGDPELVSIAERDRRPTARLFLVALFAPEYSAIG